MRSSRKNRLRGVPASAVRSPTRLARSRKTFAVGRDTEDRGVWKAGDASCALASEWLGRGDSHAGKAQGYQRNTESRRETSTECLEGVMSSKSKAAPPVSTAAPSITSAVVRKSIPSVRSSGSWKRELEGSA